MSEFPAIPFWTDAYNNDCGHLTDAEHGRYLLLIMLVWKSPQRRIPNDPEWIGRKLRRSAAECQSQIMPLVKEFCQTNGNWITQKRITKEWNFLENRSKKQSDSAKSRWQKEKNNASAYAEDMPNGCQTDA